MSDPIFAFLSGNDPSYIKLTAKAANYIKRHVPNSYIGVITPPDSKDSVKNQLSESGLNVDDGSVTIVEGHKHFGDWNILQYILDIDKFAGEYDPVVFVDTDTAILGNVKPFIKEFQSSGKNYGFLSDVVIQYPKFKQNWDGPQFVPQSAIMFFKADKLPALVSVWERNWKLWIEPAPFVQKKNPARFYKQSNLIVGQYALAQSIFELAPQFEDEVRVVKAREINVARNVAPTTQRTKEKFLSSGSSFSNVGKIRLTVVVISGNITDKKDDKNPNPVVTVKVGDSEKRTKTLKDTSEPAWNQEIVFPETNYAAVSAVVLRLSTRAYPANSPSTVEAVGAAVLSLLGTQTRTPGTRTHHTVAVKSEEGAETGTLEIDTELLLVPPPQQDGAEAEAAPAPVARAFKAVAPTPPPSQPDASLSESPSSPPEQPAPPTPTPTVTKPAEEDDEPAPSVKKPAEEDEEPTPSVKKPAEEDDEPAPAPAPASAPEHEPEAAKTEPEPEAKAEPEPEAKAEPEPAAEEEAKPKTEAPAQAPVDAGEGVAPRNYFADPSTIPEWLTSAERIPQYAVDYARGYYEDLQKEKEGQISSSTVNFFYDTNGDACLETKVEPANGYVFKHNPWTNQWWKDVKGEIGMGKIRYKHTRKSIDEAEARIEDRRKDPVFSAIEKVVLGVANEYDYDFLKAYNVEAKYRDPNVKKGVCEDYANAVVEAFAGNGLVDHVEKWSGGHHAWNVVVLTDGRKIYTDACWYCGNNIDDEGYVEHIPRRTPWDVTFDEGEFNNLGGGVDQKTEELVKAHFAFDDVKQD